MRHLCTGHVNEYIATVKDCLRATLQEAQVQSTAATQRQKQYYDLENWCTVGLKPGDPILVKADAFQGKRKIKDRWEDKPHEVVHQIMTDIPLYKVKDQQGHLRTLHCNWLPPHSIRSWCSLMCGCPPSMGHGCTSPTPVKPTPEGSDNKTMPQEDNGLVITQH